jgi:ribosome-binding protein aMBF1 (putative translation factor)
MVKVLAFPDECPNCGLDNEEVLVFTNTYKCSNCGVCWKKQIGRSGVKAKKQLGLSYGATLRRERKRKHVTLCTLADRLHLSVSYLSDIELGKRLPLHHGKTELACGFLGIKARHLMKKAEQDVLRNWRGEPLQRPKDPR